MLNLVLVSLLFWQAPAADGIFTAVEKTLKDGAPKMAERDAVLASLKAAVRSKSRSNVLTAQVRYEQAAVVTFKIGLETDR